MDEKLIDEILDAVLPPIEAAESQTNALIQLLRERGILTDDDFHRFQEQAENASEIKSRAMRLRLKRIFESLADESAKLKKQVDDLADQKTASEEKPDHRDKGGPPTKEEAAQHDQKQETPAAHEDRERQEPRKKAS